MTHHQVSALDICMVHLDAATSDTTFHDPGSCPDALIDSTRLAERQLRCRHPWPGRILETMLLGLACRGVLAEYGSVAKYCSDNAGVPVLMMPPASASLEPADPGVRGMPLCNTINDSLII